MPVDIILGLQWGDEGKGKIVDLLSVNYEIIARFQGGPNAGHTIIIGDKKFVLHQIPSGMTRPGVMNVIGNGVVLDPIILKREIESLEQAGLEVKSRLLISRKANLILPTHRLIDAWNESDSAKGRVGSTLKGIGPTYQDKTGRFGLRIGEIFAPDFMDRYNRRKERHLALSKGLGNEAQIEDSEWLAAVEYLRGLSYIDSEIFLNQALKDGKNILAEGAQGTLLDIDFGTYPFVTSSNTISASVCTGLGIAPQHIREVFGIFKAYTTRVGEGPFPSELQDEVGEYLRKKGHEFGSTTGRPRRTGWLDMPALDYATMINGVTQLIMMKMDVMDGLDNISVVDSYTFPDDQEATFSDLSFSAADVSTKVISMAGWAEGSTRHKTRFEELPTPAADYISYIESRAGCPISIVSTGPERDETIIRG